MSAVWAGVRGASGATIAVGQPHACRAERLIEMIRLIKERPRTSRELADYLGIAIRTAQDDLMALQSWPMYVPLWRDDDGKWALLDGWRLGI